MACKVCSKCKEELTPINSFVRKTGVRSGQLQAYCKKCFASHKKERRGKDRDKARREASDDKLKNKYGITRKEYDRLLEVQESMCAICGFRYEGGKRLAVDHCHETGQVRGLLCISCNRGIGMLKDSTALLNKAIEYLRRSE